MRSSSFLYKFFQIKAGHLKQIAILLKFNRITIAFLINNYYLVVAKKKEYISAKAKVVFKSYNQNDNLLFPPCLGDFIAENDPVRVLNVIVDNLDISGIEDSYAGGGASSYNPRMLVKVVFYAYLQNVYSGRRMEQLLRRDVNFMWLSGMQRPDFNTINLFRKNRLADVVDNIFTQVVQMLVDGKFVTLDVQYVDGTKIEASANKYTFVWKKATKTNQGKLDKKVKAVLAEAEKELNMELGEPAEEVMTSEEIKERTDRIIAEMDDKGISDKRLRKAVNAAREEYAPKMKEYEDKLDTLGDRNSYSKTDPDASFMRMKEDAMNNGQTKPGYKSRYQPRISSSPIIPPPGVPQTGVPSSTIWTPSMSGTEGIAKKWLQTPDMEAKRTMSIWISMR